MLESLKKHHIGIVVDPSAVTRLEVEFDKKFHWDRTQGVKVCFIWNNVVNLYFEYFTKEGRAKKYDLGLNHVCYEVETLGKMKEIESYIKKNKLGFRLTFPEKSESAECDMVTFYKLKNMGIVEFNIRNIS